MTMFIVIILFNSLLWSRENFNNTFVTESILYVSRGHKLRLVSVTRNDPVFRAGSVHELGGSPLSAVFTVGQFAISYQLSVVSLVVNAYEAYPVLKKTETSAAAFRAIRPWGLWFSLAPGLPRVLSIQSHPYSSRRTERNITVVYIIPALIGN